MPSRSTGAVSYAHDSPRGAMPRRAVLLTDDEDASELGEQDGEEDLEEPMRPCEDEDVRRRAGMFVTVVDANVRNLDFDFRREDQRGEGAMIYEVVSRLLGDMRFLGPTHASNKWQGRFRDLLDSCTELCVERVTEAEKQLCRVSDRCVVCGTRERSARQIVHVFCEKNYSASAFAERPEDWPAAFDAYIGGMGTGAAETLCLPCGDVEVLAGYAGAFAVGATCLEKLKKAVAAQNFVFDQMVQSWQELRDMGQGADEYQLVPTLTEARTAQVAARIDAIRTGKPDVISSPRLWETVRTDLATAAESLGIDRLQIAGETAALRMAED